MSLLFICALATVAIHTSAADEILLVNGMVFTGEPADPWAEAVAISGSRIYAVGSNTEIGNHIDKNSRVVDLENRIVIPGIIDSHAHLWLGALALHGFNLATPQLYLDFRDEESLIDIITDYANKHPNDEVLFGRVQFDDSAHRSTLDLAESVRPVVIHAPSEHAYWVNSRTLELAGIKANPWPDPSLERYIVRDSAGMATGVINESAMQLIDRALPEQPLAERMAWVKEAARYLNSYGITSVTNATGSLREIEVYSALHEQGELTVRTRTAFGAVAVNHRLTPEFLAELDFARSEFNDSWVSAGAVKFFSDGAGGPPLYDPEDFREMVVELDRRGYQILTHTLSPLTASTVLDAYEAAAASNGPRDRRFRVEHGIFISPEDIPRLAAGNIVASMQPDFCCFVDDSSMPSNAWKTISDAGATLVFGSDWPVNFPPDPFGAVQQSVLRAQRALFSAPDPTAPKNFVSRDQRLTSDRAILAYTLAGAYANFSEHRLGTIAPGKEADLIVLTQNIFEVPPESIGNTQVLLTIVGGRVVYEDLR